MGSSNNLTNEDEPLLSRVYNDLDVRSYKWRFKNLSTLTKICKLYRTFPIILIYLFIKDVLFILMYLYKCKMHVGRVESLSFHMITNLLYRQTTVCTEGGSLTREHCTWCLCICTTSYFTINLIQQS